MIINDIPWYAKPGTRFVLKEPSAEHIPMNYSHILHKPYKVQPPSSELVDQSQDLVRYKFDFAHLPAGDLD